MSARGDGGAVRLGGRDRIGQPSGDRGEEENEQRKANGRADGTSSRHGNNPPVITPGQGKRCAFGRVSVKRFCQSDLRAKTTNAQVCAQYELRWGDYEVEIEIRRRKSVLQEGHEEGYFIKNNPPDLMTSCENPQ